MPDATPETPALTGDIPSHWAARTPDKPALITPAGRLSYAELHARAERFARALVSGGIGKGTRIAILCANGPEYVAVHFGAARAGAALVHLSQRIHADELRRILAATTPRLVMADAAGAALLEAAGGAPGIVGIGAVPGGTPFQAFLDAADPATPLPALTPDDPCSILFTGGTTGRPKGAVSSHRARMTSAVAAVEDFPLREDDMVAVTTPLCHAAALFTWFQPAMLAGATAVLQAGWDVAAFINAAEAHAVTGAFMVPVQLAQLLASPAFEPDRLRSLEMIAFGGAPAPPELLARAEAALPHCRVVLAFGTTETGHLTCLQPVVRRAKPGSIGRPGPHMELCVFAAPGTPAAVGEVGEIATRGPHLMAGYLDEADETAAYFRSGDGWGWTGDLGAMDAEGDVTLAGRARDMIIAGGLNVYPAEIEAMLMAHPDIAEAAVFGIADAQWGELPAAAVVLRPGARATEAHILAFAAGRVARFQRPRLAVIMDELPRTHGGKVQRTVLRERFKDAKPV